MTPRAIIITLIVFLQSCAYSDKDFNLTETERSLLNVFNSGDTIYFASTTNDVDTILVLGIDSIEKPEMGWIMAKPAYKDVWISIKHLPADTFYSGIFYNEVRGTTDTNFNQIISIRKLPQQKKVEYTFMFKNFLSSNDKGLGELHEDTIINSTVLSKYYIIENDSRQNRGATTDIDCLYWTNKDGFVGYKYNNGTFWTKKSSR